jgi:hypothetical protein
MKNHLLILLAIVTIGSHHAIAQSYHKEDSLLTVWINNLAKYSKLPVDSLIKKERDSAHKLGYGWLKERNEKLGVIVRDDQPLPADSELLHFMLEERIKPEFLK